MCGSFITKEKQQEKWLGQILSSAGLADSVDMTVKAKESKIRGACIEIALIINDWRSQEVGAMNTALMLWESCCIPSMLHGSGSWVEITKETEKRLNTLQCWFVRLVLQIGPGSPLAALLWDNALLDMGLRIWIEKILLVFHIRSLDSDTLANRVYVEQKEKGWPALYIKRQLVFANS